MRRWKRWIVSIAGSVILLLILGLASLSGCGAASLLLINSPWRRPVIVEIVNNDTTVWRGRLDGSQIRTVYLTGLMAESLEVKATLHDGTVLSEGDYFIPDHVMTNIASSTMFAIGKTEIVYAPWRYWMAFGIEPGTFLGDLMSVIDMFSHGASCLVRRPLYTLGW